MLFCITRCCSIRFFDSEYTQYHTILEWQKDSLQIGGKSWHIRPLTITSPTQQNSTISYYCTHDGKRGSCLTTRQHKGATIWANPIRDLRGPSSSRALETILLSFSF
jgi:hypothetical protein